MRGIVTLDRQPDSALWAIWVTSISGGVAHHANAVVLDALGDADAVEKVRSLTRDSIILTTQGTSIEGLPIDGKPLIAADIDGLLDEVVEHQKKILAAIERYKAASKSRTLTSPTFADRPVPAEAPSGAAKDRAFTLANYIAAAWAAWLATEAERLKRIVQPRTGITPWIMPADMSDQGVATFPPRFAAGLVEQALV